MRAAFVRQLLEKKYVEVIANLYFLLEML